MAAVRQSHSVALLVATVLGGLGCLPHGPVSISLESLLPPCEECERGAMPPRCSAGCNGPMPVARSPFGTYGNTSADGFVAPPHSLFHPVPTRPVFTPWIVDEPHSGMVPNLAPSQSTNAALAKPTPEPDSSAIGTPAQPAARRNLPAPINLDPDDKSKPSAGGASALAPAPRAQGGVASGGWHGTDLD
jgi:hypothetical protein